MPIVENTHTARIVAVNSILFLPAELKGEGRGSKLLPSKTALTQEQFDACMADRATRKLFDAGYLRVVEERKAAAPVAAPAAPAQVAAPAPVVAPAEEPKPSHDAGRQGGNSNQRR